MTTEFIVEWIILTIIAMIASGIIGCVIGICITEPKRDKKGRFTK